MRFKSVLFSFCLVFSLSAFGQTEKINWVSIEEADQLRLKEPRKVIIDVYTDWCGWCKRMDKTTFHDPSIVSYINANYYAVKMDGEYKDPITLGGKEFKFVENGRRGYHELPAELMQGKMSYPTLVFLDESMNLIQPLPGYQTAKDLEPILSYLAEDHFKTTQWEKYVASYNSKGK